MIMHPSSGHGVFGEIALGIGANSIYELTVSSVPFSGYDVLVSSVLASICNQIEEASACS